ncbi:MAG: hypothetical protein H8E76_04535 [Helicobacteraceae bacterium]|nr:hypothetical protein [Candidatus Sulfurimonas ponti]
MRKFNTKLLLLLLPFSLVLGDVINVKNASVRTSYENVEISSDEDMGLLGLQYLLEEDNGLYYGLAVYGAVSGDRGGFFVGGFTGGYKTPIYDDLYFDIGAYVGGGGGASAGQGGGLMLKSYAGVLYQFDDYALGLHYSYIDFPNGDINSKQLSLVGDIKFQTLFIDKEVDSYSFKKYNFRDNKNYLQATYQTYFPKANVFTRGGSPLTQNINLVGIEYGEKISKNYLAYFESAGAMGGATGYMEVLVGLGYTQNLFNSLDFQTKLSLGGAGGGEVDTGGGLIAKGSLNLNYTPIDAISTGLGVGYYHAFDGGFDATFMKAYLGYNSNFITLSDAKNEVDYTALSTQKFHLRVGHQTYFYSDNLSTNASHIQDVHLMGMKLDLFLTDNVYLTGQAIGAYSGEAGGYAAGMFGLGYIQPLVYDIFLVGEVALGASGGGSIDSGEGKIIQPMAGLMYPVSKDIALEVMYGKIMALDGNLDANVLEFSLVYKFGKLVSK